jgi:hypothetical protein
MRHLYNVMQLLLRKLIDILMTYWLWTNKRHKQAEERKNDRRK